MKMIDPVAKLTNTYAVDDLAALIDGDAGDGPFLTVLVPAPSDHADSRHRLSIRWRNARREIGEQWNAARLDEIDAAMAQIEHGDAEAFAVIQRADGELFVEEMGVGLERTSVFVGDAPRLVEILEHRQRTLPHLVVLTDRVGADLTAFDGGRIVTTDEVEGDTEHITRSAPGGWSQRRFQQRAENTWEQNASDVADAVTALAREVDPVLIAIAGDVRAKRLVAEGLPAGLAPIAVEIEPGDPDAIAEEVLRLVADAHARLQLSVLDQFRSTGGESDATAVFEALNEGRVAALLVDGDLDHRDRVDGAVVDAIRSSADVIVVPRVAEVADGAAALMRW